MLKTVDVILKRRIFIEIVYFWWDLEMQTLEIMFPRHWYVIKLLECTCEVTGITLSFRVGLGWWFMSFHWCFHYINKSQCPPGSGVDVCPHVYARGNSSTSRVKVFWCFFLGGGVIERTYPEWPRTIQSRKKEKKNRHGQGYLLEWEQDRTMAIVSIWLPCDHRMLVRR